MKIKKRIISGVENLDTIRLIVGRLTSFSPEIEFCSVSRDRRIQYNYLATIILTIEKIFQNLKNFILIQ
ncbi:hypothetical protein AZJ39_09255 [Streptococcus pneumoniae]|uniref:Uncharacterized protein n=1 Tax=Streptococcus pneumoniae TaxID=1313 RepID=A0A558XS95_STREE|nr:hypothetical protein AK86_09645 [Streptococcus pneumoniae B1599]OYL09457.1 hypothetical protein AK85_08865 [Streptococcus pneumoniae B1598]TVV47020.1 hypothetical protein AZK39_07380 [Streptococcus pneumoniae]TVV52636.1 hypothetical protein AZK38_01660 [Streptococcus pneumoniae]TVV57925.1 hypothetical protein AZK37_05780 [Streptococcus pneumoniae]